jgi:hypothetical protein
VWVAAAPVTRRAALGKMWAVAGGIGAVGLIFAMVKADMDSDAGNDEDSFTEAHKESLALQREAGWDVGAQGDRLRLDDIVGTDVAGHGDWLQTLQTIADDLKPAQSALAPYYVSTLFQSLALDAQGSLRTRLAPIHNDAMATVEAQAKALASVFAGQPAAAGTALVVDVPGAFAVAAAAALADTFDPVMLFDNWPHPQGVVPSQQVLAAAIYYRRTFVAARAARKGPAPAAFVVDRERLARYVDNAKQFDNRYLAKLPPADKWAALGIKRILYVTPDASVTTEIDDLNDDFVAAAKAGVDVKMVALTDFMPQDHGALAYGGTPEAQARFLDVYGWHVMAEAPQPQSQPAGQPAAPAGVSRGWAYKPVVRQTMFSKAQPNVAAVNGRYRPRYFGYTLIRTYRYSGASYSFSRSGSWNRAGGGGG